MLPGAIWREKTLDYSLCLEHRNLIIVIDDLTTVFLLESLRCCSQVLISLTSSIDKHFLRFELSAKNLLE